MAERPSRLYYADEPKHYYELNRYHGKEVWKGPDLVTYQNVTLFGNDPRYDQIIPVVVTPDSLPAFSHISREAAELTNTSVRSRWAQLAGLDIGGETGQVQFVQYGQRLTLPRGSRSAVQIEWFEEPITDKEYYSLNGKESFIVNIPVHSYAARPVFIPRGSHIFRYFHISDDLFLTGREPI